MGYLFSGLIGWIINKFIIYVFILTLLVGFTWAISKIQVYNDLLESRDKLYEDVLSDSEKLETAKKDIDKIIKQKLNNLNKNMRDRNNKLQIKRNSLYILGDSAFSFMSKIPRTVPYKIREKTEDDINELESELSKFSIQRARLYKNINPSVAKLKNKLETNKNLLAERDKKLEEIPATKIIQFAREKASVALGILIGIIMIPVGIKVLFYYVIAPLVEKRPSIQLLPNATGQIHSSKVNISDSSEGDISSVSIDIKLAKNEKLVIRPEYIQSLPHHYSKKRTQWFINRHLPLSSISTGLVALTQITTENSEPVIVSPTKHPLMEVSVIELLQGAAIVCRPRSLAGVIYEVGKQINITKHWRIFSLQSWLTFQLRYLVIHGPCKLIINGCRGVCMESAHEARTINQSATLGFSANLNYANSRCETFFSYWTGKEDLYNDLFQGERGIYIYEQMPDQYRKTSIFGRGIEGFVDSLLKVFGL